MIRDSDADHPDLEQIPLAALQRYIREPINGLSHALGIVLSIVGLVLLLVLAQGEPWRTTSFVIYGLSLIMLYTASTLMHSLHVSPKTQRRLRLFDHAAIFALIAGSYTPITLITLRNETYAAWGWTLFGLAWGVAILGIVFKIFWLDAPRWLSTGLYLLMGWMSMIAIIPIVRTLPLGGVVWLGLGGLFYSIGAIIFALRKPDWFPNVFGYHELWHMFVLAGSISHFVMIARYVAPL